MAKKRRESAPTPTKRTKAVGVPRIDPRTGKTAKTPSGGKKRAPVRSTQKPKKPPKVNPLEYQPGTVVVHNVTSASLLATFNGVRYELPPGPTRVREGLARLYAGPGGKLAGRLVALRSVTRDLVERLGTGRAREQVKAENRVLIRRAFSTPPRW